MTCFLTQQGTYDVYKTWDMQAKRTFMVKSFADRLARPDSKAKFRNFKEVQNTEHADNNYTWMSKAAMITAVGEVKALAKISSGKLATRTDPDSGLDDEWNMEYKVYQKTGGRGESVSTGSNLEANQELGEGSQREQAGTEMESMMKSMAGNHEVNIKV